MGKPKELKMPKGKILMGKTPIKKPVKPAPKPRGKGSAVGQRPGVVRGVASRANKPAPKIKRSGNTMSGYNYGTNQGPGFTGGSPYREPMGTEVSGSSIRPQLDKMSISGSTTNTRQRGGGVSVYSGPQWKSGTWRYAAKNDILEKTNADYAYNKGVLNEIDARAKDRITRNNQKRKGGK